MKVLKLLNLLFLVSSAVQEEKFAKLAKFACDVVEELVRDQPETKTVSISLWPTWFDKKFVYNSIAQCMTPEVAIISRDMSKSFTHNPLLSSDFIIMISDQMNWPFFVKLISDLSQSPVFNHNAKFILLTKYSDPCQGLPDPKSPCNMMDFHETVTKAAQLGVFNFVWAYLEGDEINPFIYDFSILSATNQKEKLKNNSLIKVLYPDKLKDLNKLSLNILTSLQTGRFFITENGTIMNKFHEFLYIVSKKMNAILRYDIITPQDNSKNTLDEFSKIFVEKRARRSFILTLNNNIKVNDQAQKLLTYEDSSVCVLVPLPKDETFGTELFVKPFDKFVWLALGLSFLISSVVWKIISKISPEYSSQNFSFGFYAYLLGQEVNIRNHELALKILLQIIIFMTIILSSSYEGVITSLIIGKANNRLKTLDDVLESETTLLVGNLYDTLLKDNILYNSSKIQGKVNTSGDSLAPNFTYFYEQNFAVMIPCITAEIFIQDDQPAAPFYYLLPERLFPSFVRLDAGFNNPYIGRIQEIMDECFAAGLHQAWETFFQLSMSSKVETPNENHAISLNDLKPVFIILLIGNSMALLIFLVEIISKYIFEYRRNRRIGVIYL